MNSIVETIKKKIVAYGGRQATVEVPDSQGAVVGLAVYILESMEAHEAALLARQMRAQLVGTPGMIVEIPKVSKKISLSELVEQFEKGLKVDDIRYFRDIIFVPDDSVNVQLAIVDAFGYSDKSLTMEERLKDCKNVLIELSKVAEFRLGMVGLGHVGIFFVDKVDAGSRKKMVSIIDQFVCRYNIRDLSPKSLDTHIRVTGSVII